MFSQIYCNINNINKTSLYDFFSNPHNPEELFSLLYLVHKCEKYSIYKAIYNETREIFCIKIIPQEIYMENNSSKNFYNKIKEETSLMKSLINCENILQYKGSFYSFETKKIWLIYEYLECGSILDLTKIIERNLSEEEIAIIINDILHGLIYLHQLNIVNRNIKISNILLDRNGKAKIGNFEKAIQKLNNKEENDNLFINENIYDETKDIKYDIFLLSITCIEMYIGIKNKFDRNNFIEKIKNINDNDINIIFEKELNNGFFYISNEFKDFLIKCLSNNASKRPTAFELINHSFIRKNINEINKKNFCDLIKNNVERIEYNKEIFYKKNNNKKYSFYKSRKSNKKNTIKSGVSNLSNLLNKSFDNKSNIDKLAEFRIEQMKNNEIIEDDKYTSKDLYSNLDNSSVINSDKKYINNFDNKINKNNNIEDEKEKNLDNLIIKESDDLYMDLDFKSKWEHIKNFQNKLSPQFSEKNLKYKYSTHILNFNTETEEQEKQEQYNSTKNINSSLKNVIAFTETKCDIIRLNPNVVQKSTKKLNDSSIFTLKNSFSFKNKDNKKLILSLRNTVTNNNDIENKISTRNESINSKNNFFGVNLDKRKSYTPFKNKKILFGDNNEINSEENNKGECLYKYLYDFYDDKNIKDKNDEIKKHKTAIIKVNKLFKKQKIYD